jgi:hypothetical protein
MKIHPPVAIAKQHNRQKRNTPHDGGVIDVATYRRVSRQATEAPSANPSYESIRYTAIRSIRHTAMRKIQNVGWISRRRNPSMKIHPPVAIAKQHNRQKRNTPREGEAFDGLAYTVGSRQATEAPSAIPSYESIRHAAIRMTRGGLLKNLEEHRLQRNRRLDGQQMPTGVIELRDKRRQVGLS